MTKLEPLGPPKPLRGFRVVLLDPPEGFPLQQYSAKLLTSSLQDAALTIPSLVASAVSEYRSAYKTEPRLHFLVDGHPYVLYRGVVSKQAEEPQNEGT